MLPTRTLSKRYSADEIVKLCRRCNLASETPYRILQMCPFVLEPRHARHNISKTIIKEHRKHADISSKGFFVTRDGVRLRPDVVLCLKNKTFISDVVIAWDARMEVPSVLHEAMTGAK
ncbi:hypothetical protein HPB51_027397 [Rhipicephalus microplus]|uniref:Uncharacterized protein n=1 Tax=Rhipicephalus microplus TaxID=6941 RepID=A0A9J6D076_RHIMP|nr:hypothetical protein HPB51_027397 [Rhipicephalus microplus]